MATSGTRSDFITEQRHAVERLLEAVDALNAQRATWDAGMNTWLTDDDFQGENAGLTAAHVGAVVFDTANAMRAVLDTGHATNVARLL